MTETEIEFESINKRLNIFGYTGHVILTYKNDTLSNINFDVSRRGSFAYGYFQTVGKLISLCIRRKVKVDDIIEKLNEVYLFDPAGMTNISNEPLDSFAKVIAVLLKNYYKKPEKLNGEK